MTRRDFLRLAPLAPVSLPAVAREVAREPWRISSVRAVRLTPTMELLDYSFLNRLTRLKDRLIVQIDRRLAARYPDSPMFAATPREAAAHALRWVRWCNEFDYEQPRSLLARWLARRRGA